MIFNLKKTTVNKEKVLGLVFLGLLIGFNFYLYWPEFLVLQDVNDNTFHFALINQAKEVWESVLSGKLSLFYLVDSWNLRWGQGFALSVFYSHLPQVFLALLSFIFGSAFKLFVYVRTLMLILLPLSFFLGSFLLSLPVVFSLALAFLVTVIFANGLYGIDPTSFLWRAWGISAQLMAVFFLPLAFAYSLRYLDKKKDLGKAVLFNFLVAQSHFGIFYLSLFIYPLFIFLKTFKSGFKNWKEEAGKLIIWGGLTFLSLSYFIIPFFLNSDYRNFSYWDPVWKFDSWGIKQSLVFLFNGEMFDFQRFPLLTLFVLFGFILSLKSKRVLVNLFSVSFLVYFVLFFGRSALGPLLNLIPGLAEYHLHRIAVFIQFTGLFLAAWFVYSCSLYLFRLFKKTDKTGKILLAITYLACLLGSGFVLIKPVYKYAWDNSLMVKENRVFYNQDSADFEALAAKLSTLPQAVVYTGHPGNWGRNFKFGQEPLYMALSGRGFSVMSYMPQTWSPNADTQQFFSDQDLNFYRLYNISYLVMPQDLKAPEFAKEIFSSGKYHLYQIETEGWFTVARSSINVSSDKRNLVNLVHLWQQSQLLGKDFPVINLRGKVKADGKINLVMLDLVNFKNLNQLEQEEKTIWQENPFAFSPQNKEVVLTDFHQEVGAQSYKVNFELQEDCQNCILVFKQSYNPGWKVKINGKRIKTFPVFPFFTGVNLEGVGEYQVEVVYKPLVSKIFLIFLNLGIFTFLLGKRLIKPNR